MPIEHASVRVVHKPWGVSDLRPWSSIDGTGDAVGELWFERADKNAPFLPCCSSCCSQASHCPSRSIPTRLMRARWGCRTARARHGTSCRQNPDAQIGVGLKQRVTPQELRASIRNGSIVDLVQWRPVAKGDVIFVPAGTIHAIGAGIVLAEIQQQQRRDVPPVRLWQGARIARRRRRSRRRRLAASTCKQFRPALRLSGRFLSRADISFSRGLNCRRARAGRCWPSRRPGFSFSTATRQSDWPRYRSGRRSSSAAVAPASRSASTG